jgi:hypothetical protein
MKITINVDDRYIRNLQKNVGGAKPDAIAKEALSLYGLVVEEVSNGRKIISFHEAAEAFREINISLLPTPPEK